SAVSHLRFDYDVLVIGAGGAGLRAVVAAADAGATVGPICKSVLRKARAVRRASVAAADAGATVGLICKSLLGKAHTVMAEGGIAAALSNVDDRDDWRVHFADTMRGGQYVNNWRMAELHAREAPDRVREL